MAKPAFKARDATDGDPFYWGSRLVEETAPGGRRRWVEVPLTRADVLDPQEGDRMVHGAQHGWMIYRLLDQLTRWFDSHGRNMTVFTDVKMRWGVPGLAEVAPDLSVVPGYRDPDRYRKGSYSVPEEGALPVLAIEVVSPRYAKIDHVDKVKVYRQARVAEYLIVDITGEPAELTGYRLTSTGAYYKGASRRRWDSLATGLRFQAGKGPMELILSSVMTGERLPTSGEETLARRKAEVAQRIAEQRAAAAAEAQQREAEARQREAEARQREAEARQREAEARREAERRADEEAAARRALEAELERLRRELERR